jgi:bifunctional NMN adenylyltransferase/nudix hydrolase
MDEKDKRLEEKTLLKNNQELGVIICRMQVPFLTDSHRKMIETVQQRHQRVLILLGVARDALITEHNPFPYDFRKQMVQQYLRKHDDIQGLLDNPSDTQWVEWLDYTVQTYLFPGETAVLYGGRDSFIPFYIKEKGKFATIELAPEENDSGTALREVKATLPPIYSPETACAILWFEKKLREQ